MRSDSEILLIFRSAFRPLRCDARVVDHGRQIVFRVFGSDRKLIYEGRYPLTQIRTDEELRTSIQNARNQVAARASITLDAWSLPKPLS